MKSQRAFDTPCRRAMRFFIEDTPLLARLGATKIIDGGCSEKSTRPTR